MRTIGVAAREPGLRGARRGDDGIAGCGGTCASTPASTSSARASRPTRSTWSATAGSRSRCTPPGGGTLVIETLDEGDVVGWSWLVPPYRWAFDARALDLTRAVAFDGACLRGKCDDDPGSATR